MDHYILAHGRRHTTRLYTCKYVAKITEWLPAERDGEKLGVREVAAVGSNTYVQHKFLLNFDSNGEKVHLAGSKHAVLFSAYTRTYGAMLVFVLARVHWVVGGGTHDVVLFLEAKDVMVVKFEES